MIRLVACILVLLLIPVVGTAQFTDWSPPENLGPLVNSPYQDSCVCVSKSGLSLFFFSNRYAQVPAPWHLYVSNRTSVDEEWGLAQEIVGFNDGFHASCPALSPDEHRLFFASARPGGCGGSDIWVSRRHDRRDDFGWGPPENLGCVVNSSSGENLPTVFEDETGTEVLYFSTNRPGGPGFGDIYESRAGTDDTFGPAALVAEVSTPADDAATVRRDGLEIVVAVADDLFAATRESMADAWSTLVPIPVLNTSYFEGGRMSFSFNGRALYFRSDRPGGYGLGDLYVATREKLRGRATQ
jgi:hypothetical protein